MKRTGKCPCQLAQCENYGSEGLARNAELCLLCGHEFAMLRRAIAEKKSMGTNAPGLWLARSLLDQAERESDQATYWVLRALYLLCVHDNSMSAIEAYEKLCGYAPLTAAQVFDYNMKERTGGGIYTSLATRVAALLPPEQAPARTNADETPL